MQNVSYTAGRCTSAPKSELQKKKKKKRYRNKKSLAADLHSFFKYPERRCSHWFHMHNFPFVDSFCHYGRHTVIALDTVKFKEFSKLNRHHDTTLIPGLLLPTVL